MGRNRPQSATVSPAHPPSITKGAHENTRNPTRGKNYNHLYSTFAALAHNHTSLRSRPHTKMAQVQPILVNGEWIQSTSTKTFQAVNPVTKEDLPHVFPV